MLVKILVYDEYDGFRYKAELNKDVFFAYLFKKKFKREFKPLECLIDKEWRAFYDKFNDDWLHNRIKERAISEELDFNDFLLTYFMDEARNDYYKELAEEIDYQDYINNYIEED